MKILIISDSHGKLSILEKVIEKEKPKIVIFCGDFIRDIENLEYFYTEIVFIKVRGNCDFDAYEIEDEIIINIGKDKILITHGHLYDVKNNLSSIEKKARQNNVNIVIFGHTHKPYLNKTKNNIILFNPGAIRNGTYGILLMNGQNKFFLKNIEKNPLKEEEK
jgi:hypothetical protein